MKAAAFAVVFALCIATSAQQVRRTPVAATVTYRVAGVVVNGLTGEPVAGANVALEISGARRGATPEGGSPRSVSSGSDGSFLFPAVPAGNYVLSGSGRGFAQQLYEQHDQYTCGIVVGAGKETSAIRFRLQPDASLSGTILDDHNDPVANAQVMLFREGIQNGKRGIYRATMTNSRDDGYYHFAHLHPGSYYVAVSAVPWYAMYGVERRRFGGGPNNAPASDTAPSVLDMAFPLTFYPSVTDEGSAEPIHLTAGDRENADLTLTAVPALHVTLHTPPATSTDNSVASLNREIFGTLVFGGGGGRHMGFGQGVLEIFGVTPGRYLLQVRATGANRTPEISYERDVDIVADSDLNAGDVSGGVSLKGTVRFDGPPPSREVGLELIRPGMPPIFLHIDAQGNLISQGTLFRGSYELLLPAADYQITQASVAGAKLSGQSLQVGSDDVQLSIVAAKASARINGFVRNDGQPLPGALVVLVPQDLSRPRLYRRDESNSDGSFELTAIPPGTYTLLAIENGWDLEWANPAVIKPYLSSGNIVRVAIDGRYDVDPKVQTVGAP